MRQQLLAELKSEPNIATRTVEEKLRLEAELLGVQHSRQKS
jgi:hypothetical protein